MGSPPKKILFPAREPNKDNELGCTPFTPGSVSDVSVLRREESTDSGISVLTDVMLSPEIKVKQSVGHLQLLDSEPERKNLQKRVSKFYKTIKATPGKKRACLGLQLTRRLAKSPASGRYFRDHLGEVFHFPQEHALQLKAEKTNQAHMLIGRIRKYKRRRDHGMVRELTTDLMGAFGSFKNAAKAVNMNWRTLQSICRIKEKKGTRYLTEPFRQAILAAYERQDISLKLPLKRHCKKRFLRVVKDDAYLTYMKLQQNKGLRHFSQSAVNRVLVKENFRVINEIPLNSCECPICENYGFLITELSKLPVQGISDVPIVNITKSLCAPAVIDDTYVHQIFNRNPECILGECNKCGAAKLLKSIVNRLNSDRFLCTTMVTYERWKADTGEGQQPLPCETVTQDLHTALGVFYRSTQKMVQHYFAIKWQANQFEVLIKDVRANELVICMDFAQNFDHLRQDEVKSCHYNRSGSTVHAAVCYYICPQDKVNIVRHTMICISDDNSHNYSQVFAIEQEILRKLRQRGVVFDAIIEYCDNAGVQYKCMGTFDKLSRSSTPINRNYFCPHHGKSVCDAAIGRLKALLMQDIRTKKCHIGTTEQLFEHCDKAHTWTCDEPGKCCHKQQEFFLLKAGSFDTTPSEMNTLVGTRAQHSVRNVGIPGVVEFRIFSCFCNYCRAVKSSNQQVPPSVCHNYRIVEQFHRTSIDPAVNDVSNAESSPWVSSADADARPNQQGPKTNEGAANKENLRQEKVRKKQASKKPVKASGSSRARGRGRGRPAKAKRGRKAASTPVEHDDSPDDVAELAQPKSRAFPYSAAQGEIMRVVDEPLSTFALQVEKSLIGMPLLREESFFPNRLSTDVEDELATFNMPPALLHPHRSFPVAVMADGNCLPRALSRIVYGHEGYHEEMRLRLVFHMVFHIDAYLKAENLRKGLHEDVQGDLVDEYASMSGVQTGREEGRKVFLDSTFLNEVKRVAKSGMDCSMWCLHAAANVLKRDVVSVFPNVPGCDDPTNPFSRTHQLCNRRIEPFDDFERLGQGQLCYIMWSQSLDDRVNFNHLVPLVRFVHLYSHLRCLRLIVNFTFFLMPLLIFFRFEPEIDANDVLFDVATASHWHDQEIQQKEINEQLLLALQRERAERELNDKVEAERRRGQVRSPEELPFKKRGRPPAHGASIDLGAARQLSFGHMSAETVKANEERAAKFRGLIQQKTDRDSIESFEQDSSNLFGDETAELLQETVGDIVERLENEGLHDTVSNVNVSDAQPQAQLPAAPEYIPPGSVIPVHNEQGEILVSLMYDDQGNMTTSDGSTPPSQGLLLPGMENYVDVSDADRAAKDIMKKTDQTPTSAQEQTSEKSEEEPEISPRLHALLSSIAEQDPSKRKYTDMLREEVKETPDSRLEADAEIPELEVTAEAEGEGTDKKATESEEKPDSQPEQKGTEAEKAEEKPDSQPEQQGTEAEAESENKAKEKAEEKPDSHPEKDDKPDSQPKQKGTETEAETPEFEDQPEEELEGQPEAELEDQPEAEEAEGKDMHREPQGETEEKPDPPELGDKPSSHPETAEAGKKDEEKITEPKGEQDEEEKKEKSDSEPESLGKADSSRPTTPKKPSLT